MQTGQFNHRLELQQQTGSQSASGEWSQSWGVVREVWAHVTATAGGESLVGDQLRHEAPVSITIRQTPHVKPDSSFRFFDRTGDIVYEIVSVVDPDGRRNLWSCRCKESSRVVVV